jgi:hypothetical protein
MQVALRCQAVFKHNLSDELLSDNNTPNIFRETCFLRLVRNIVRTHMCISCVYDAISAEDSFICKYKFHALLLVSKQQFAEIFTCKVIIWLQSLDILEVKRVGKRHVRFYKPSSDWLQLD